MVICLSGRGDKDMPTLQRTLLADIEQRCHERESGHPGRADRQCHPTGACQGRSGAGRVSDRGIPSKLLFTEHVRAIASSADVVEIGVPFTDPMADGVTIQRSSEGALSQGVSLRWILSELTTMPKVAAPLLLMSYLNPLLAYGVDRLPADAAKAGVNGFIVPDMPVDESDLLKDALAAQGIALVQMVTPVTTPARLSRVVSASTGFVYAVTMTGVTGKNVAVPGEVMQYLDRVRAQSSVPVCAGFGIRSRDQVTALRGHVDGVIIGSALALARGTAGLAGLAGGCGRGRLGVRHLRGNHPQGTPVSPPVVRDRHDHGEEGERPEAPPDGIDVQADRAAAGPAAGRMHSRLIASTMRGATTAPLARTMPNSTIEIPKNTKLQVTMLFMCTPISTAAAEPAGSHQPSARATEDIDNQHHRARQGQLIDHAHACDAAQAGATSARRCYAPPWRRPPCRFAKEASGCSFHNCSAAP
ncbi:MAG: tryptophan synthase subunit alpha [Steroidobacteraceae bacterium]